MKMAEWALWMADTKMRFFTRLLQSKQIGTRQAWQAQVPGNSLHKGVWG